MLVVEEMKIVETRYLAPRCKQVKVLLDDTSYKRISFEYDKKELSSQWMSKGEYVSDSKEKILEKLYLEIKESN